MILRNVTLLFDYLVVATGYAFPFPESFPEDKRAFLSVNCRMDLDDAKSVIILGGGARDCDRFLFRCISFISPLPP